MSQRRLHIASTLSLPLEFATSTQAILAIRGAGKTYTASVVAEEMLKSKVPVIVIDPTGSWWGLKSSKDGAAAGYPIVVFGGEHADVPLEDTAGEAIARAIVEHRFSAILDLKLLRKGQWYRLLAPFLETLYHLNREPVHLFVDEAHRIAPQRLAKGAVEPARVLGAMEDIAQMGRSRGLGCTVISQRPAVINKNVLTQCPVLCCLRVVHNLDLDAVRDWVKEQADLSEADEMIRTLPSLPTGDAWFWWPEEGIQKRVRIRERETFDSSKTPKVGEKLRPPKVMAEVDIQQLGEQIKATVERAKLDDPKLLKAEVLKLRQELKRKLVPTVEKTKTVEIVKVPEIPREVFTLLDRFMQETERASGAIDSSLKKLTERGSQTATSLKQLCEGFRANIASAPSKSGIDVVWPIKRQTAYPMKNSAPLPANGNGPLPPVEQNILDQLNELAVLGIHKPEKSQLALMSGYTNARSGGFSEPLAKLLQRGYLIYPAGGLVMLTGEGKQVAADVSAPLSQADLHARLCTKLGAVEGKILSAIVTAYPEEIQKESLASSLGYQNPRSGGFSEPIGRLRSLGIVTYPNKGTVKAADWLFIE